MRGENSPILEVLIDKVLEIYNSRGLFGFDSTYPDGVAFSNAVGPLIKQTYPLLSNIDITYFSAFYDFIRGYLKKFSVENRFSSVDEYWKKDIYKRLSNSDFCRQLIGLEARFNQTVVQASVA